MNKHRAERSNASKRVASFLGNSALTVDNCRVILSSNGDGVCLFHIYNTEEHTLHSKEIDESLNTHTEKE
ncbi:hypothetical protein BCE02nite_00200 [Brevibacillus centrosporus]|nr:hypothetical protein EDM55_02335 [Brevibacillus centrosporus]GED28879.1 hypothetical protein BCE02nite_00200 [Brevibacillus centrosporus]